MPPWRGRALLKHMGEGRGRGNQKGGIKFFFGLFNAIIISHMMGGYFVIFFYSIYQIVRVPRGGDSLLFILGAREGVRVALFI